MTSAIQLPNGTLTMDQWERIQAAVLARGDVSEYPLITLFPDSGEPAEVEEELRRLKDWLEDEDLLDAAWWA